MVNIFLQPPIISVSQFMLVSYKVKDEVTANALAEGLETHTHEYYTKVNVLKIENVIIKKPLKCSVTSNIYIISNHSK